MECALDVAHLLIEFTYLGVELLAQGVGGTADGLQLLKVSIQQLEMPLLDAMDRTTDASESDEVASLGLGGEAYLVFTL